MAAYATLSDVKQALPDVTWGAAYDNALTVLLERASRLIDALTGRQDNAYAASSISSRVFTGSGTYQQWIDELAAWPPSSIEVSYDGGVSYSVLDASGVTPYPPGRFPVLRLDLISNRTWPRGHWAVKVTGIWGYSTTPPPLIVQATVVQVVRWFKRGQQAFQDVGAISEIGQLRYVQALDPDLVTLLYNTGLVRLTV